MQSTFITNILLTIIAVLLLVMLIQNGMRDQSGYGSSRSYSTSSAHPSSPHTRSTKNPTVVENAAPMGESLYFRAMSAFPEGCDGLQSLDQCESPAAQMVKKEVTDFSQGRGPREVFDHIIEKYGMQALTEQAQQIRKMRTGE